MNAVKKLYHFSQNYTEWNKWPKYYNKSKTINGSSILKEK